ncbi:hypothetical protein V6Z11_A03G149400 [Gossypium hirsutum]
MLEVSALLNNVAESLWTLQFHFNLFYLSNKCVLFFKISFQFYSQLLMLLQHTFCSQTVNDTCRSLKSYLASVALDYVFIVLPTFLIFTNLVFTLHGRT